MVLAQEGLDTYSAPLGEQFDPSGPADGQRYGSDLVVDFLKQVQIPWLPLNPGASFRGLHDSLVNYGGNTLPEMILCQHEEIAVGMAHGYAKATGQMIACVLHDTVGLLHACMAIYYAYLDRAPVLILGATGPMNEAKRRPHIDWIHTANVQGNAIRDYTKWDDQPSSVDGIPGSLARAYRVALTEPQGPVYVCLDAQLQEDPLPHEVAMPRPGSALVPTRMAPDPAALERIAALLAGAKRPVILAEYVGRDHAAVPELVRLAETLAIPVIDGRARHNFPTNHPLCMTFTDIVEQADLLLALDVRDLDRPTQKLDSTTRQTASRLRPDCTIAEIGFADLELSSWSMDYGRFQETHESVLADTSLAIPMLADLVQARVANSPVLRGQVEARRGEVAARHAAARKRWQEEAREDWDASPMTTPRLALEVWDAIKDEDWVLTSGGLKDWVHKLWDIDQPYRHPGRDLGTGTQIGISLGVALAHKGTGRLVVDFQPDGDLMFDAGALWVATKHEIPLLVVMFNNRAYYNDWEHQIRMARRRKTPLERANIGMDMRGPEVDFAGLARSQGWYAEGPIENPADLPAALQRAIQQVKAGKPALLDTVTRFR
ncbi:MAG: thiamine pyrophosphate-binding protein [Chloroflexi bacterium]|nr:thiamine pyrophosphate-binding protein [Chloroflexota bacterium]